MWEWESFKATVEADEALAASAGSAEPKTDDAHSHPDPETYRERLIWIFSTRATIGRMLRKIDGALDTFRGWVSSAQGWADSEDETPDEVRTGFADQIAELQSLEIGGEDILALVQEEGADPERLAADGFDLSGVA